ncbi:MAG TPA: DUF3592 domain-containing protein [Candidatus Methylacidiphilales bacterium]|jgi:hypothetical protein|nr:DUF3592 domain-containing protein [Candidatus Methylacidiphilales bacterium]
MAIRPGKMKPFLPILLYVVLAIAGCFAISWGAYVIYEAWVSASWAHTTGIIQESHVDSSLSSGPHGGGISYNPVVTYAYTVDGHSYLSSKIDTSLFWSAKSSRQIVDAYPLGSQRPVYFASSNPADSMLLAGLHSRSFQAIVLATLLTSGAILFGTVAYLAPKYGKKEPDGSYFFDSNSPVTKFGLIGLAAIACQFVLLWNLR